MKKKRFSAEQIVTILKEADLGIPIAELIRQVGVSDQICSALSKLDTQGLIV